MSRRLPALRNKRYGGMGSVHEMVLRLAETMTGESAEKNSLLEPLCTAAEEMWKKRLRRELTPEACASAFACAAALFAAAGIAVGRGGEDISAFTAGDVSVQSTGTSGIAAAAAMYEQAERLMAPYTEQDDFAFYGVRG